MRERLHAGKVVTTGYAGAIETVSYGAVPERNARLANALGRLGVRSGDRVATLAWNSQCHRELYLAVPCMGALLDTVGPVPTVKYGAANG